MCWVEGWRDGEGKQRWKGEGSGKAREAFKGKGGRWGYINVLKVNSRASKEKLL